MKKLIGYAGVDSGQILICDPCYIESEWEKEGFDLKRRYKHTDGTVLEFGKDFPLYDKVIPKYGKSMNDLRADKEVIDIPDNDPPKHNFSYNACAKITCGDDGMGQLNYKMGHPGVGVICGNFGGDGEYPVYADIDKDGMVTSLTIKFY